jgi:hypothetical protein
MMSGTRIMHKKCGVLFALAIILVIITVSSLGCQEEELEETTLIGRMELSSMLMPDIDLNN